MTNRRVITAAFLALLVVLAVGCGGDDDQAGTTTTEEPTTTTVEVTTTTRPTTTTRVTTTTAPLGSFDNPVPALSGVTLELMDGTGSMAYLVSPAEDGQAMVEARSANCNGSGCLRTTEGRRWVYLKVRLDNDTSAPVEAGWESWHLFGAEGVERLGRGACSRDQPEGATVLPDAFVEYVQCFELSDADLVADELMARVRGDGGEVWFAVSTVSLDG